LCSPRCPKEGSISYLQRFFRKFTLYPVFQLHDGISVAFGTTIRSNWFYFDWNCSDTLPCRTLSWPPVFVPCFAGSFYIEDFPSSPNQAGDLRLSTVGGSLLVPLAGYPECEFSGSFLFAQNHKVSGSFLRFFLGRTSTFRPSFSAGKPPDRSQVSTFFVAANCMANRSPVSRFRHLYRRDFFTF